MFGIAAERSESRPDVRDSCRTFEIPAERSKFWQEVRNVGRAKAEFARTHKEKTTEVRDEYMTFSLLMPSLAPTASIFRDECVHSHYYEYGH
mgnify:CR=1 FL=1